MDRLRAHTAGRGIWTIDRGGDRKKLLDPLLERRERFVIRSTGQRSVINRRQQRVRVHALGARCRLRYGVRVIGIEDGQENILQPRFGAEPIRLPGWEEKLQLVVIAGWGQEPILLIISRRFFGIPPFHFYALADGIRTVLMGTSTAFR